MNGSVVVVGNPNIIKQIKNIEIFQIKKRGLNREILSPAPTQFYQLLKAKAAEAGCKG